MRTVKGITQTTNNRFLNMYELDMENDNGKHSKYFVASRAKNIDELKISTRQNTADGVIVYSVYRDEKTKEEKMLRAALIDTLGDPSERRYMVTIMSDSDPVSLSITGTDVIGMEDGDIIACGSQIITPTDVYLAFQDGEFIIKS